ncbi:MFS transporter [Corynebacterium lowii]|uniref:Major Facilitator Superfamily protein n=1 Tax=Corynebacterium lowii TaxID=1544413 RepID=A0A0Q0YVN7_9CORY|nr:MFS transporter [Corynebacterium lowii]KQB86408.1 Major Facilitator Superfamily protein [Corynebacterium lowii]MDP9850893.1 MFS family permease [Corynebacterium lowii]
MSLLRTIWPIILTQIFTSAGVGLNLTVAALAATSVTGTDKFGGLAQTSTILGATVITIATTHLNHRFGRLTSLRLSLFLAVAGSLICGLAVGQENELRWILFVGLFLLGGGTVGALLSRFVATEKVGNGKHASTAISSVLFGSAIGSAIGPNIYGIMAGLSAEPMRLVFLFSALIFAGGILPLL